MSNLVYNLKRKAFRSRLKKVERQFEAGNYFEHTLFDMVKELEEQTISLTKRVYALEQNLEEAGITESVDVSDVKYKVTEQRGPFGTFTVREAYQVNKVKVK